MKAVILAGGKGTRLRPLTDNIPKPLIPVDGRPFILYQIDHLKTFGVDEVVLSVSYLSEQFKAHFEEHPYPGLKIRILTEPEPLGTGGGLRFAAEEIADPSFFAMNGDSIFDIDFGKLKAFHEEKQAIVTIALKRIEELTPELKEKGIVKIDEEGRIVSFSEKPDALDPDTMFMSSGFYVFTPVAIAQIPPDKKYSLEEDLFPKLIRTGKLYALPFDDYFVDIGRHETLQELQESIHELRPSAKTMKKKGN